MISAACQHWLPCLVDVRQTLGAAVSAPVAVVVRGRRPLRSAAVVADTAGGGEGQRAHLGLQQPLLLLGGGQPGAAPGHLPRGGVVGGGQLGAAQPAGNGLKLLTLNMG